MAADTSSNVSKQDFHHPYQPYNIQTQFMTALYDCIEQGKVGIFESPTGTGKSLSLICGSLTWLRNHKRAAFDQDLAAAARDDEPEWMRQHAREEAKQRVLQKRIDLEKHLEAVRQKERKIRERFERSEPPRKRRKNDTAEVPNISEEQYVLDDYQSDDDKSSKPRQGQTSDLGLSNETQALMQKLGLSIGPIAAAEDSEDDAEDELKIFFCSRTHSQLTQFVGELRRVQMPSSYPTYGVDGAESDYPTESFKHISLASRKNLCVNDKVLALKHPTAINERCLELQESKTAADHRCTYLPNKENQALMIDFQHHALAKVRDIEDLGVLGRKIGICPYYAARPVVNPSEIVSLPYQLLLQTSAREALGVSVKDHIVIIDEAHNLMDAILGIYTVELSLAQLQRAREQLTIYLQKFRNRLKGKNRIYVTQVVRLLDSLRVFLEKIDTDHGESGIAQVTQLLNGKGVDQINLYKLMQYLQESKLARKVQGYALHSAQQTDKTSKSTLPSKNIEATAPVLTHVQSFLMALTNPEAEGRFFYTKGKSTTETKLKYLLLDPSEHFKNIIESARSVILAGGTMSPMDDYMQQLFPYLPASRISTLSCGHVIPPSNMFVSGVTRGQSGTEFDFTFGARNSPAMMTNLGETLLRVIGIVPDGVVVFFPSYGHLEQVVATWKQNPAGVCIWSRLEKLKALFVDVQSGNNITEDLLTAYSAAINGPSSRGALLLSVIGGKLSEGINFSDRLGRCVIVVGLPYPNPHSPEWKARMQYIEQKATARGIAPSTASRDYAENVCMRAVNQAIGRAVRHQNDWAAILLLDRRYAQRRVLDKLPRWIRASLDLDLPGFFGDIEQGLQRFYKYKK